MAPVWSSKGVYLAPVCPVEALCVWIVVPRCLNSLLETKSSIFIKREREIINSKSRKSDNDKQQSKNKTQRIRE